MAKKKKVKLTKEEKRRQALEERARVKKEIKEHPFLFSTYVVLRVLVVAVMILQITNREWYDVFLCALTLTLFLIPSFVERRLHIDVPNVLEVIILLFIFSAEILGEIQEYYLRIPFWDTILHTINGFLMAAIGIAMVDILNRSRKFRIRLSPVFVAVVAFCFSMTIGVLWEFFEYGMDVFFHMDMQKDTYIPAVTSVLLNPDGRNAAVTVPVESIVINGEAWPGYIDIGLHDTMKDLLVNFIGAVVFSLIGMIYIMGRGRGKFAPNFIPRLKEHELPAPQPQDEPNLLTPILLGEEEKSGPGAQKDCIFCKIAAGEAPCYKIYEDDAVLAFLDVAMDAPGHTLVIPKGHEDGLFTSAPEITGRLMEAVRIISRHYVEDCGYDGVNILNASGAAAQQSVPHLHFHILPRKEGDGLNAWPKLGYQETDLEAMRAKLTMIKEEGHES